MTETTGFNHRLRSKRGCGALVERLIVSPVMYASRGRTPLMLRGVFREISLFLPSQLKYFTNSKNVYNFLWKLNFFYFALISHGWLEFAKFHLHHPMPLYGIDSFTATGWRNDLNIVQVWFNLFSLSVHSFHPCSLLSHIFYLLKDFPTGSLLSVLPSFFFLSSFFSY